MLSVAIVPLVLLLAVIRVLAIFLHDRSSLRRFPSPSFIAALTPFWRIYKNYRLNQFSEIHKAHQQFGTHVRIAPNHISISSPEAAETIYGHGANFLKDIWYDGGAGDVRTMADTRSKQEHQTKRKRMAHIFSQRNIASTEYVIAERTEALLKRVADTAEVSSTINIRRFVNYFTIDVITAIMFGKTTGCLEKGSDMVQARTKAGTIYTAPVIDSLHASMRVTVPVGYLMDWFPACKTLAKLLPLAKSGSRFDDIVSYHVADGIERVRQGEKATEQGVHPGFLRQIISDRTGSFIDQGEIIAECSGMLNAGSDTTSTALANAVYLLSLERHRYILQRLRLELAPIFEASTSQVPSFDSLSQLPFLRACIDETLRLRPSSAFGLPREVPAGGRWIAGQLIPEGVSVSVPTYSLLHNTDIFEGPEDFRPERWVDEYDEMKLASMKKYYLPFSTGPRACIGRNIAYYEMTLVVAVLMHYFDFDFEDGKVAEHYAVLERLNANPDELVMRPRRVC